MPNNSRGGAAARITSVTARTRTFAIPESSEAYVANSPALAGEALVADHTRALPDYSAVAEAPPQHARAVWLLVVWLVVSGATIAAAAGVIAKYF
jgi:hypothetical protein